MIVYIGISEERESVIMNMRYAMNLASLLAVFFLAAPAVVLAEPGQAVEAQNSVNAVASTECPRPGEKRPNLSQTSPADCCKDHKGVCGCRAGKIICCDGTASTQPGCTCHGDDGFLQ